MSVRRRRRVRAAGGAAVIAAAAIAGCGGPMQPGELRDSLETVESAAAEGALLATHAADDRTKTTFTRTRARQLSETLDHEVEKLGDATPEADLAGALRRATEIASQAEVQVGDLAATPRDRPAASDVASALRRLAAEAHALGERQ